MLTSTDVRVDLLIRHAHVLTLDDVGSRYEDGAIAIRQRRIEAVGPDREVATGVRADRVIDAHGAPVHPGLVDAHVHASFTLLRGIHTDDTDEDSVFDDRYAPFLAAVTDEDEHAAVVLACLEMVRNGTTTFLEAGTVLEPSAAAEAAALVGMRAVLGDAFVWDRPGQLTQGPGRTGRAAAATRGARVRRAPTDLDSALARLGGELWRNAQPDALVRGHICLNGLGTASEALMLEAKRRADAASVVLSMHHAYSAADSAVDRERFGPHPLEHFAGLGILDRNVTLAHANELSDVEVEAVVRTGASLVWAPSASMLWGHGHGRHVEVWRRGGNVALASDSANWSNDADVFRQADLALLTARARARDRRALATEDVLRMATRGGAQAAGLKSEIGRLATGMRADLVIHSNARPELVPRHDALRNVVSSGRSKSVRSVIIDGRVVLDDGHFPALDEARLLDRAARAADRVLARVSGR